MNEEARTEGSPRPITRADIEALLNGGDHAYTRAIRQLLDALEQVYHSNTLLNTDGSREIRLRYELSDAIKRLVEPPDPREWRVGQSDQGRYPIYDGTGKVVRAVMHRVDASAIAAAHNKSLKERL